MNAFAYLLLVLALIRLTSAAVFANAYAARGSTPRFALLVVGWISWGLAPLLQLLSPMWTFLNAPYSALAVVGALFLAYGGLGHFLKPPYRTLVVVAVLLVGGAIAAQAAGLGEIVLVVYPLLEAAMMLVVGITIVAYRRRVSDFTGGTWVWLAGVAVISALHTLVHFLHILEPSPLCHVVSILVSFLLLVFYLDLERVISTRALLESESRFRGIFDHSPVAVLLLDRAGTVLLGNQSAARFVGVPRAESLIGGKLTQFVAPEASPTLSAIFEKAMATGNTADLEYRVVRADGSRLETAGSVAPLFDSDGQPSGLILIAQDISERVRAEETRRELERIIRASPAVAFLWSASGDGTTDYVSANVSQFGYSAEDFLMQKVRYLDLIHPEDRPRVLEEARSAWDSGQTSIRRRYRILTASGDVRWVDDSTWVHRDDTGKIVTQQGLIQDVTERQQLLMQVREQALQLEQIIEAVPEGVVLLDTDRRVVLANPEGRRLLAILAEAKAGDQLTRLGEAPLDEILTPLRGKLWHTIAYQGQHFEAIASSAASGAAPATWVLVVRDVTEQVEATIASQQQERLATLGHMAAGIAHDFNNIMAVVVLYAQMGLRRDDLPGRVSEYLNTIVQQARRASSLIQQILDFSRRSVLERGPLHLSPFLSEQIHLLGSMLPENIRVDYRCQSLDPVIDADPTRIQQVVMNLAINARDAMPDGGNLEIIVQELILKPNRLPPVSGMVPGPWVQIIFRDSGGGIPESMLPHLFQPFYTTKAPGQGSGLGLAQVWGIVTQHGGKLTVSSKADEGTTFAIYLPALPPTRLDTPLPVAPTLVQGSGQSLLVVEDNPDAQDALVDSLRSLNYRVYAARDGFEALELMKIHGDAIALVLSDAVMPKMGGIALLRELKPAHPSTRFILMTGHPLQNELAGLRAQGMDTWLLKPVDLGRLSQAIAEVLRQE